MILYGVLDKMLTVKVDPIIDKMGDNFKTVWSDYTDSYLSDAGLTSEEIIIFRLRCFNIAFIEKDNNKILKRFVEYNKSITKYGREHDNNYDEIGEPIIVFGDMLSLYAQGLIDGHRPIRQ